MKIVQVSLKDLYQFLITECRYGYSRNNHLMPDGAYDHVKTYLPFMKSVDADMAINTAKQLCEECIEMELFQFSDGIDDEYGNRKAAFQFISEMINFIAENSDDKNWRPYNYDKYENNVAFDSMPRYDIYEAEYTGYNKLNNEKEFKLGKKLNKALLSKNHVMIYICSELCKSDNITYRKYELKPDWKDYVESNSYTFKKDFNKQILTKYVFDDIKKAVIVKRGDC